MLEIVIRADNKECHLEAVPLIALAFVTSAFAFAGEHISDFFGRHGFILSHA